MRTLLVDNYDSYTYNLFQLIAAVTGVEPLVLANDAPAWAGLDLTKVDSVVISPGPGHPGRPRDIGRCGEVLARAELPLLGVCLGHQGIGYAAGGLVRPAPQPRHGQRSRVRHTGHGLFAGLPQDFQVVRYHSLCVAEPLPADLEAVAWADDGVLMALRHRRRPHWGVQFHPESVATEHGAALLANFRDLALRSGAGRPAARRPAATAARRPATGGPAAGGPADRGRPAAPGEPNSAARGDGGPGDRGPGDRGPGDRGPGDRGPGDRGPGDRGPASGGRGDAGWGDGGRASGGRGDGGRGLRLRVAVLPVAVDTERAYQALYQSSPTAFWLDSSRVQAGLSRFSFLGDASGPLAEVLVYRVGAGAVEVRDGAGRCRREPGTIFDVLAARLRELRIQRPPLPFDLTCGYVGYFGYELKADCGGTSRHRAETPDAVWLLADRMLAIDHQQDRSYLLALDDTDSTAEDGPAAAWTQATAARLRALPRRPLPAPAPPARLTTVPLPGLLRRGPVRYLADIAECHRQLRAGESYEICLTDTAVLPAPADPVEAYRRLRRTNPAPYAALFRHGGLVVASSSPERFLRITADRVVESRPVKGTAPRSADPHADEELRRSLATSAKTRAENLMIVDLLRNDLGRVCEIGSVAVPRLMATESYATMHQLVSTVRGRLRAGLGAVDCVRAAFPGGSMTGAPKLRTMEIIDRLETHARGVYSGALGYFGPDGTADLSIVIRTLVSLGATATVGAGGAIVLDSDPPAEYAEMLLKAAAALDGLVPPAGHRPADRPADLAGRPAGGTVGRSVRPGW
jgi:para-aminobenzoate synthetase